MYLFLDLKKNPACIGSMARVLHVAIGADGAPFRKDDTATGNIFCTFK